MTFGFDPHDKKFATIRGRRLAYVEVGDGPPIVFLHGNPTSSFVCRRVIPEVAGLGRCLALDLLGMGDSDKLPESGPDSYAFAQHRTYVDEWLSQLGAADGVTFVLHDWGSALGFDWASRHPEAVRGLAYMEAIVRPLQWADMPAAGVDLFRALRSPAGEPMILEQNLFVEGLLPGSVLAPLAPDVLDEYRRPFRQSGEGRRPTLTWARQIPIEGEPADVALAVQSYHDWLADSPVPKLFVNAEPGAVLTGSLREVCRSWPHQTEVTVPGVRFLQEDSGRQIGRAIAN